MKFHKIVIAKVGVGEAQRVKQKRSGFGFNCHCQCRSNNVALGKLPDAAVASGVSYGGSATAHVAPVICGCSDGSSFYKLHICFVCVNFQIPTEIAIASGGGNDNDNGNGRGNDFSILWENFASLHFSFLSFDF